MAAEDQNATPMPTLAQVIGKLEELVAAGESVTVYAGDFDVWELVDGGEFMRPGDSHQLYDLKMYLYDPSEFNADYFGGPTLQYDIEVAGVDFYLEDSYASVRDGEACWMSAIEFADGDNEELNSRLQELLGQYVVCELPDAAEEELPCEGVGWEVLMDALQPLVDKGVALYTDTVLTCVYARYPDESEADFLKSLSARDIEVIPATADRCASILEESMEYRCLWD